MVTRQLTHHGLPDGWIRGRLRSLVCFHLPTHLITIPNFHFLVAAQPATDAWPRASIVSILSYALAPRLLINNATIKIG
jgi:hypothetical protein